MSNAFAALIWWVVPAFGLIGALGYVVWVTKFQGKFQQETQRSVGQFQRFQDSLRDSQARDVASGGTIISTAAVAGGADANGKSSQSTNDSGSGASSFDTGIDAGSFDTGIDAGSFDSGFDAGSSN
jgi:hypothetical protein